MAYFPLFTDIQGKKCLVAGGGKVALRKVRTLLDYGADVRVTALTIEQEIADILPPDACVKGLAEEADIEGAALVVAATGSRSENHRIAQLCYDKKVPVNVIDCPEECTFLFPAVVRRGDISIGINTGAKSPGLSGHLRRTIEETVPDYYEAVADRIGEVRDRLKREVSGEKRRRHILAMILEKALQEGRSLSDEEIESIIDDK